MTNPTRFTHSSLFLADVDSSTNVSRFLPDRDSNGVRTMFCRLLKMAVSRLSYDHCVIVWHTCRGLTTTYSLLTITDANRGTINRWKREIKKILKIRSDEEIPRVVWGLYSLAWGRPIVNLFKENEEETIDLQNMKIRVFLEGDDEPQ